MTGIEQRGFANGRHGGGTVLFSQKVRERQWHSLCPARDGEGPVHYVFAFVVIGAITQQPEATVSKDAISVHRVERGAMPLREVAAGSITSITPPMAIVRLSPRQRATVRTGQKCSIQIVPPTVLAGKVGRISQRNAEGTIAQIDFSDALPPSTTIGDKVGALIDVGIARDVLFFARPADARPNSTSILFVLEGDGDHAKRVAVEYGRQSGSLIEVLGGLSDGDRVIVTDMSAWAGHERVRLK